MRKLRYNVAMTLDGFIADPNGGYDWIIKEVIVFSRTLTTSPSSGIVMLSYALPKGGSALKRSVE